MLAARSTCRIIPCVKSSASFFCASAILIAIPSRSSRMYFVTSSLCQSMGPSFSFASRHSLNSFMTFWMSSRSIPAFSFSTTCIGRVGEIWLAT